MRTPRTGEPFGWLAEFEDSQALLAAIQSCKRAGYRRITLWTQSHLAAARKLYVAAGYERVAEEPHHSFGLDLVAETWTKTL